ncbi:MAG: MEKHLA domain-containing protein [Methyloprofundus sp.]|nr:MEKHLA domain-containing protein [Methyloprofundus sp.]
MSNTQAPCPENAYLSVHAELLMTSYRHWTGKDLIQCAPDENSSQALFQAAYGIVSHNTEDDPIFNYANQAALDAFVMSWAEFTQLASRKSAAAVKQVERDKVMASVSQYGFIDHYQGTRITATGQQFMIADTTIWNIVDAQGQYHGQAAVFYKTILIGI